MGPQGEDSNSGQKLEQRANPPPPRQSLWREHSPADTWIPAFRLRGLRDNEFRLCSAPLGTCNGSLGGYGPASGVRANRQASAVWEEAVGGLECHASDVGTRGRFTVWKL